jgi:hypothetical protein
MGYVGGVLFAPIAGVTPGQESVVPNESRSRRMAYSPNMGASWTIQDLWPELTSANNAASGNGIGIIFDTTSAQQTNGYYYTSTNGINWTQRAWPFTNSYVDSKGRTGFSFPGLKLHFDTSEGFFSMLANILGTDVDGVYAISVDGINWVLKDDLIKPINNKRILSNFGQTGSNSNMAFKPETDDIREAPALYIIDELLKQGATVSAFDPEAMANVKTLLGDSISFTENQYDALINADALLIATEWSVFRNPNFEKMDSLLANKVVFDGRNLFDLQKMIDLGYYYNSVGRKLVNI